MLSNLLNRRAVATIVAAQVACAINWFSASSVFSLVASDLSLNVAGLGVITSAFILGVGLFQLPAGLVAAKQGPKRALLYGVFLTSTASVLSGFVDQLPLLAVLRFIVGLGEAFIFGPGAILISRYFRKGSEGLSLGLFGGAFDFGGIVGILGWAILGSMIGWRMSLVLGGAIGLVAGLMLLTMVPSDPVKDAFFIRFSELKKVLLNKWLLLISFGLLTVQVGFNLSGYFMVYYLEDNLSVGADLAGVIGSLTLAASVVASPLAGRVFDRIPSPKRTFIISGLVAGAGLAIASLRSIYAAFFSTLVVGASTGAGFAIGYSIARRMNKVQQEYEAFGLSWVNGIALFGGVWTPVFFSELVVQFSYSLAWLLAGVFTALMILPVLALRSESGT
ncbi:MAG: MFS transporter [Thaumarchaeota archaeon]|nr:MFS transporter [Nitrososphaerota archaeon]